MHFRQFELLIVTLMLLVLAAIASPAHAQPPTPTSCQTLIEEIKEYAARHVKNDSPMQTQLVVELYRNNSSCLTPVEIAKTYEEEYTRLKEASKPNPLVLLQPNVGWFFAVIFFLLLIFRDILKEWFTSFIKEEVGNRLYNRLAGGRFFSGIALRHYRKALVDKYQKHHLPFRPEQPLDVREIYVPLKVAGTTAQDRKAVYQAMNQHRKILIIGPTGSGKSTLFEQIERNYTDSRSTFSNHPELSEPLNIPLHMGQGIGILASIRPVPVLLKLDRLNDSNLLLEQYIARTLASKKTSHARSSITNDLKDGKLILLLDGFEGVRIHERRRVVQQIRKLLDKYQQYQAVINCDTEAYKNEFDDIIDQKLEITGNQFDAEAAMKKSRKIMVIGLPGAGKSMLLKHIVLRYTEDRLDLPDQPIPVLLELHRFNDPQMSLEQHLVDALVRNDFPRGERFVSYNLKNGELMLLLDGLDEVNSTERKRVVQQIKNLLDKYRQCRAVITCRTAVYNGEFDDIVDQKLKIVDFNDQQIRHFLHSWGMPAERPVDQLMQTLHDAPKIMALARNPLMLTIIAYLCGDHLYVLPKSRVAFYSQSTDVLLHHWHRERNQFEPAQKRRVLQELALLYQTVGNQQHQDRRSLDVQTVIKSVRQILPDLDLRLDQDAAPILREIVERTGLLLSVDGGQRYQFAHLTLQEYFAAERLRDNPNSLIGHFSTDHDAWRETVKLCCGLMTDSTAFILKIRDMDAITALECLADAEVVDQSLADEIVNTFKSQLGTTDKKEAVERAFSAVASDQSPRGLAVFQFLEETVLADESLARRTSAANALSLTNLQSAVRVLSNKYFERPEIRTPLVRMGDLALPALVSLAKAGSVEALDDLLAIGTPQAAEALVPLLWNASDSITHCASWRLAALLTLRNIEEALRAYKLADEHQQTSSLDWIWKPFPEPPNSSLPIIACRTANLISHASVETVPSVPIVLDPRLIIPLCAIVNINETKIPTLKKRGDLIWRRSDEEDEERVETFFTMIDPSTRWKLMMSSLLPKVQRDLCRRFVEYRLPTRNDWTNVLQGNYRFKSTWYYWAICLLTIITSVFALYQLTRTVINTRSQFSTIMPAIITISIFWIAFKTKKLGPSFIIFILLGPLVVIPLIDEEAPEFDNLTFAILLIAWTLPVIYFATQFLLTFTSSQVMVSYWIIAVATCVVLMIIAKRRERTVRNPLQGIIEFP